MSQIQLCPGANVRITMAKSGEALSGSVHALDQQSQTLVLRIPQASKADSTGSPAPSGSNHNHGHLLRFICISAIATLEVDTANGGTEGPAAPNVSAERVARLEKEGRQKAAREQAKINPDAEPKGQWVFDSISKIYTDCQWLGPSIIILDQVRIDHPYNRENIKTLDSSVKPEFIDRLANMVETVARKLEQQKSKKQAAK